MLIGASEIVLPECLDHWAERVRAAEERADKTAAENRKLKVEIDRLQRAIDRLRGLNDNIGVVEVGGQPRWVIRSS